MSGYPAALPKPSVAPGAVACIACLMLVALSFGGDEPSTGPSATPRTQPLSFVPNRGQVDEPVRYYAHASGFAAYFTAAGVTFDLRKGARGAALELSFVGAGRNPAITAARPAPGTANYFTGDRRYTSLPTFTELRYHDVWPGIDVAFRSQHGQLKYEFHVRAGAEPSDIRLAYAGADSIAVGPTGALAVGNHAGTLRDAAPIAKQGRSGVASRYTVAGDSYGFALGPYDRSRPLLIDPGLEYSTFLGGVDPDGASHVAVDGAGNGYVSGFTSSAGFPTSPGAYDTTIGGQRDSFLTKLSPTGQIVYSTYLGGTGVDDWSMVAVDGAGNAYVAGDTRSSDFPTTPGTDHSLGGSADAFVAKIDPTGGGLVYSTYLGGGELENVRGLAIDAAGHAYVTGQTASSDFPGTSGGPQPGQPVAGGIDGYVARLSPTGRSVDWATYLGGRFFEAPSDVAVDELGNAYVTGQTDSSDFPTTPGAYDATRGAFEDGFVTKIDAAGTAYDYSTLLGGDNIDTPTAIAVDGGGNAYVTGSGGADWPTTPGAFDRGLAGFPDAFITKLNPSGGALVYSTFLGARGGGQGTGPEDIALDGSNQAFVTGSTGRNVPTTPGAVDTTRAGVDAIVMGVNAAGSALVFGTYLGGSSHDFAQGIGLAGNRAVVAGSTGSSDFPVTPGAPQTSAGSLEDAFVAKLGLFQGYPRPRGATPTRLSLVVAYKFRECSSAQELQHGPPLAYSSCPPRIESTELTTGTPDSNGLFVRMEAFLQFNVIAGNASTPTDEADVKVALHVNDVLTKSLEPYTGEIRARVLTRQTDRDAGIMQTTTDFPLGLTAACIPNADPRLGSACDAVTTMDALIPGSAPEGSRAIWQFAQAHVYDAGPDGNVLTEADNSIYLRQGIFIP
jgi:hypothetical protein